MYRADELSALFHGLHHAHHRQVRRTQSQLGLEHLSNPMLLMVLWDQESKGQSCSQRELARRVHTSPATVAVSLKTLERDGYVERQADQADSRRNHVSLTDKGRRAVELGSQTLRTVDEQMVQGFTAQEQELLIRFFQRMMENLGGPPEPPPGMPDPPPCQSRP